ncbi:MAG: hypothetical protein H7A25_00145 [Leptospiraceae bacterium]|nr:hypothetical protein [Leptospiraceae bacterium]MCP5498285.1 hypothetical protein [Leptospiraceae bacterium]
MFCKRWYLLFFLILTVSCTSILERSIGTKFQSELLYDPFYILYTEQSRQNFQGLDSGEVFELLKKYSHYTNYPSLEPLGRHERLCSRESGAFSYKELNNLAVYQLKTGTIFAAERNLRSAFQLKKDERVIFLNLLRLYYMGDAYKEARNLSTEFILQFRKNRSGIFSVLNEFEASHRIEERILFLDGLSKAEGFELDALSEIGEYLQKKGEYNKAAYYYEKVLDLNSFHKKALFGMLYISFVKEEYENALLYGKPLLEIGNYPESTLYYIAMCEYELGKYKEALIHLNKAPEKEKSELNFLILWKNVILSSGLTEDLQKMKPYLDKIGQSQTRKEISELEFLLSPYGKEMREDIFRGH